MIVANSLHNPGRRIDWFGPWARSLRGRFSRLNRGRRLGIMGFRRASIAGLALLAVVVAGLLLSGPPSISAQNPASLTDEALLSLVLPPLANGARPGVHLW